MQPAAAQVVPEHDGANELRRSRFSRSPTASAAGTVSSPGCAFVTGSKSSVSSACANIAFTSAALIADVRMSVVRIDASGVPPCARAKRIAISPGFRRAPETMAAIVSRMRCFASRTTSGGSACSRAAAM